MHRPHLRALALLVLALSVVTSRPASTQSLARNVVVITIDGLRWQEFFTGAAQEYFPQAERRRAWRG